MTVFAAAASCILPDEVGVVNINESNRHAVKIVEPTGVTVKADEACVAACTTECTECPQPPNNVPLPRFLDPANEDFNFCSCPSGQFDMSAQPSWVLHVEDRDGDGQDEFDELYAALMLDYDYDWPAPQDFVAYRDHVDPNAKLPPPILQAPSEQPLGRPDPYMRTLQIGFPGSQVDLCNGTGQGIGALAPGYHTLRVIVTDRPWFRNIASADEDTDGPEAVQEGVPAFSAGASFDDLTYTFHCADGTQDPRCNCG